MKTLIMILMIALCLPSFSVEKPEQSNHYRIEFNANPFRDGETIEVGVITPSVFKLKKDSRHYWSLFADIGLNTFANALVDGQNEFEEELLNIEIQAGIFAFSHFYGDFLYQYGKIGVDFVALDSDIEDDTAIGAVLESGLEFRSSWAKFGLSHTENPISAHIGLRWRAGFDQIDGLAGRPDSLEGISIVLFKSISVATDSPFKIS